MQCRQDAAPKTLTRQHISNHGPAKDDTNACRRRCLLRILELANDKQAPAPVISTGFNVR